MVHSKKKNLKPKLSVKERLSLKKKESKKLLKEKRARLIVKNLPFKATEENLKEYFEQYGKVVNVDLLKKPDGKLVGCGFIQFQLVQKAAKARHHTNGKDFLGREIVVDFAKSKDKYKKEIKTENDDNVKEEPGENEKEDEENKAVEEISDDDEKKNDSDISQDEEKDVKTSGTAKPHISSNDVTEGRTVFVKNVPFDATNEDLKSCMSQFGRIYYALICMDKLTEHSKGTGFVKFVDKEDAEKALNAGTELTLMGNVLDCHLALGRNEIQKKTEEKKSKEPKDSRNLYLVKEGVILAGSKAAEGVSATDMAKRLQIEQYKTQMLRNLNMFVSKDRLVVHNLPSSWDDNKFRTLMTKYAGPGAVIKEARIMRDMKNVDAKGVGKSKEYGFASFSKHEHALNALRNLNNNPDIFTTARRPIITFSIENKKMVNAKLKRLEKSKLNNPTRKEGKPKKKEKQKKREKTIKRNEDAGEVQQAFAGVASKPGTVQKMRSRYKLSPQAALHHQNLKKEKRKKKNMKKSLKEKKQDFIKQPKQKINKGKRERDNFAKLVSEYKKKLVNADSTKKSKWYE